MKKNNNLRRNLARFFAIVALPTLLVSCGSYYTYYSDGIYGEVPPERVVIVERYDNYPSQRNVLVPQNKYSNYFREKSQQYDNTEGSFTHFTDVDSYSSDFYNNANGQSYAGWGNNHSQVTVNVYDNYWNNPYYGYNSFWGYGAWYPYNYYGYGYYPYYRNRVNWGISFGWGGYYNPHWGWYDRYDYPYYGYYGGFYPRHYGYYYPQYYGYYGGRYYDNRDGRVYNYDGRRYSPTVGRRGDANRYANYNNRQSSGSTSRSYAPSNQNRNYSDSRTYNRNYNNSNYRDDHSSRNYNNYNNSSNSSRSYNSGSSGGGVSRGSGSGTTRRSY